MNAYTDDEAAAARKILAPELAKNGGTPSLTVSGIGHAHIDLGWLWPIRETIRKGGRTFATAIAMMERYPDYVFGASQAQLYQWVKDYYPAVYDKVKKKIAEGRWEIQGGMWVEPDMNISGGEALVRQFIYGKRFWQQEFGKDTAHVVAARRVRLQRRAAADHEEVRDRLLHDHQNLVEQIQHLPAPYLLVGGHRRQPRPRAHAAGRHL